MNLKSEVKRLLLIPFDYFNIICYYISGAYYRNKKNLLTMKGMGSGKRCFIVCNGPSLSVDDLNKLYSNKDYSIGINAIGRIYKDTKWRANCLSATDDSVFTKKNRRLVQNTECDFKLYESRRYLQSLFGSGRKIYLTFYGGKKLLEHPEFKSDATKPLPSIGTSTFACIEFAVFLGFTKICIIGCDMTYKYNLNRDGTITVYENGRDYCFNDIPAATSSSNANPVPTWHMEVAFDTAESASQKLGFKVYNATRGGRLESFERVDFDSLF